jgi:hypothetical protein
MDSVVDPQIFAQSYGSSPDLCVCAQRQSNWIFADTVARLLLLNTCSSYRGKCKSSQRCVQYRVDVGWDRTTTVGVFWCAPILVGSVLTVPVGTSAQRQELPDGPRSLNLVRLDDECAAL